MNNKIAFTCLSLLLCVLLLSCSQSTPDTLEESFLISQKGTLSGTNTNNYIDVHSCTNNTITFTIHNKGSAVWNIDRFFLEEDDEFINPRIFFNGYVMNPSIRQPTTLTHPTTNEQLFGPQTLMSSNCDGKEFIAPGENVTCTITSLPLQEENVMWVEAQHPNEKILLRCEQ